MALHESLRELVSVRGPGVVDEAEELRGALDDFLAEDEATLGELNLLVDAVRLGALRRVLDVLANGAAPEAAIREAGASLARDRGTDDPTRSCWALATLCFALGRVPEGMVRMFRSDSGTMPVPGLSSTPHGGTPDPVVPGFTTAERPPTQVLGDQGAVPPPPPAPVGSAPVPGQSNPPAPTEDVRATPAPPQYGGPVPPVLPEQRSGRAGIYLLVVLVALILGGLVAAGFILLRSDGDGTSASDDPTGSRDSSSPRQKGPPLVPDNVMLVPYKVSDGSRIVGSQIFEIDTDNGDATPLTPEDVDARLPTITPDRRTVTYLDYTDSGAGEPGVLMRMDLESEDVEPFFADPGPCDYALRPGWGLDGTRVALVCTDADGVPVGIFLATADGELDPTPIVEDSLLRGSPTWISDTEFIYGRQDDESDSAPLTFWRVDITDGVRSQIDLGLEGLQLTHADYSPEADKVLFLVSERGGEEIGDVWTMDPDGSDKTQVAQGSFAHPVWSPDGGAIGVTVYSTLPSDGDPGEDELGYIPLDDRGIGEDPVTVEDPPEGLVGIPVWASR